VSFGTDTRIWRRKEDSFKDLRLFVEKSFEELKEDFNLTYDDDEGDEVTITDDLELGDAMECVQDMGKKSLKITVKLRKSAQRVEEPGAGGPSLQKGEENVSEPGVGMSLNVEDNKEEEEDGALNVEFHSTPRTGSRAAGDNSPEGTPERQTIQYWLMNVLPLLSENGIQEELEDGIPLLIGALEKGDTIDTALQTMIVQCELLQRQDIIQQLMHHVQMKVSPLSDEIVPYILHQGAKGVISMVLKLCELSKRWRTGVPNLTLNFLPYLEKFWPACHRKFQQNKVRCEVNLEEIRAQRLQKFSRIGDREVKFNKDPSPDEEMSKQDSKFRLKKVPSGFEETRGPATKGGIWARRNSRSRGRGSRGFMRRPRRDRGPYFRDHYGPPPPMHPDDFSQFSSTPYHDSYYGPPHVHDDFQKARSAPWGPSHHGGTRPGPSPRYNNFHPSASRGFDFDMRPSAGPRKSANRLQEPEKANEVRISSTPLKAEFVQHVNIPLRSKYLPEQKLLKKWCVRNVGSDDWDKRVMLEFTKGTESLPTKPSFPVPVCASGALCELSAMIMTPEKPGRYTSYFRLSREGTFFGPRIWVDVHVVATEAELTEDDEMTQKRLERLESQQTQQRASAQRSSQKRIRSSTRRSKKKKDIIPPESSLGFVSFPVHSKPSSMQKTPSTLNKNAEAFIPKSSRQESELDDKIKQIRSMGFEKASNEALENLLSKYHGDVNKAVTVLVEENKI